MLNKAFSMPLLIVPCFAMAESSIGVVGTYSQSIYKETNTQSNILPALSYKGERFFFNYPEIGYHLIPKSPHQSLSAGLRHTPSPFDPDESNNIDVQSLDDRHDSGMAFISYRFGPITTKLAQDVTGVHDGYYGQLSLGYPISIEAWQIIPSISYQYISSGMSDYMFGVSQSDSAQTGGTISTYDSPATSKVSYGATAIYSITKNINTMVSIKQTQYNENITNSPIVDDNTVNSFLVGIFYKF